jgi:hypothetical protein
MACLHIRNASLTLPFENRIKDFVNHVTSGNVESYKSPDSLNKQQWKISKFISVECHLLGCYAVWLL